MSASNAQEWHWVVVDDPARKAAIAEVYRSAFQVALVPVAYTTGGDFRPSPRKPVEDVILWNGRNGDDAGRPASAT